MGVHLLSNFLTQLCPPPSMAGPRLRHDLPSEKTWSIFSLLYLVTHASMLWRSSRKLNIYIHTHAQSTNITWWWWRLGGGAGAGTRLPCVCLSTWQQTPALGAGGVYFPFSMFSLQFTRTSFLSCSVQILMPLTERSRQATANTAMTRRKKQAAFPGNILLS